MFPHMTFLNLQNFSNQISLKHHSSILDQLTLVQPKLTNEVLKVFDLKNSINSKKSYGGTSFDNIKKMIIKYKKQK